MAEGVEGGETMTLQSLSDLDSQSLSRLVAERMGWECKPSMGHPNGRWCHPTIEGLSEDFSESLDAMSQAEATLTAIQQTKYCDALLEQVAPGAHWSDDITWEAATATARQRAIAFLLSTEKFL